MVDTFLNIRDDLPGIGFVPAPIEVLGDNSELNDEVAGQVLRLDLAALFAPKPQEGGIVVAHDDPGVRTSYKRASVRDSDCRAVLRHKANSRG